MGGVIAALVVGAFEGFIEGDAAALAVTDFLGGGFLGRDALFRFEHEMAGFVAVDVIRDRAAIRIHAGDGTIEDVEVFFRVGRCGIGARNLEKIAKFREEHLIIGAFRGTGVLPAGNESFDGVDLCHVDMIE